jgi:hypothetical protein
MKVTPRVTPSDTGRAARPLHARRGILARWVSENGNALKTFFGRIETVAPTDSPERGKVVADRRDRTATQPKWW